MHRSHGLLRLPAVIVSVDWGDLGGCVSEELAVVDWLAAVWWGLRGMGTEYHVEHLANPPNDRAIWKRVKPRWPAGLVCQDCVDSDGTQMPWSLACCAFHLTGWSAILVSALFLPRGLLT